jgi:site-specific DNA recombinase
MRVYRYTRVSLEEQARNGISLDMQRVKIEAYALVKDRLLVRVICDDGTGPKL